MEQGSLRVDANISIRRPGEPKLGTKTEVKNLNSFANVERALEAERERQIALLERGERVAQVTLLFNAGTGQVRPLRSKEESHDYRYFPDPDLPPLVLAPEWIAEQRDGAARAARGAPRAARDRLRAAGLRRSRPHQRGRPGGLLRVGGRGRGRAEDRGQLGHGRRHDHVQRDRRLSRRGRAAWPALVTLVREGVVSHQAAKRVYAELAQRPGEEPKAVAERLGLVQVSDQGALGSWVDEVLAAHPAEVARYRGRRDQADGVLRRAGDEEEQGKGGSEGRAAGAAGEAGVGTAVTAPSLSGAKGACVTHAPSLRSG